MQIVRSFQMSDCFHDRGMVFVSPKLCWIEDVIGRQFVFCQSLGITSGLLQRETWGWMGKNSDLFVRCSVKPLHFAFACFGTDNNESGVLQDLRIEGFAFFPLAIRAYFREKWLKPVLQIPNDGYERNR